MQLQKQYVSWINKIHTDLSTLVTHFIPFNGFIFYDHIGQDKEDDDDKMKYTSKSCISELKLIFKTA